MLAAFGLVAIGGLSVYSITAGADPGGQQAPPQRLDHAEVRADNGISLDPPSASQQPNVSADAAVATARSVANFAAPDSNVTPTFAIYTNQGIRSIPADAPEGAQGQSGARSWVRIPVWIVTFDDVCVPFFGPAGGAASGCAGSEWNVVVDADSGEYIQGFSDR
jgi:hypothetical protein